MTVGADTSPGNWSDVKVKIGLLDLHPYIGSSQVGQI